MTSRRSSNLSWGITSCPICDKEIGRAQIVELIVFSLRQSGSFSVQSVSEFWQLFGTNLCHLCTSRLESISEKKQKALALLNEAVKLDPNNDVAVKNLQTVRGYI